MNKLELVQMLKEQCAMTTAEAEQVIETFFNSMKDALKEGERVEIRGLLSFFVKEHKGYVGRNPKTGEKVLVPAKRLPFFKCGKDLRDRVNQ